MKLFNVFLVLGLLISLVLLSSCSTTDAKVIECSNLLFDCGENDCSDQCGKVATDKGKVLISSEAINDGSGCLCEYTDAALSSDS